MKKKLIGFFVISLALIGSICSVNATAYSKTKNTNLSVYTATYNVSEKATFYDSGDTRWTYSNLSKKYVSGNSGKGVSISSKSSGSSSYGATQTTKRTITLKLVDYNYVNHSSSTTLTWTFDNNTKKFK